MRWPAYHEDLPRRRLTTALLAARIALAGLVLAGAMAQEAAPYLVVSPGETRTMPVARRTGTTDFIALDMLPRFFDIALREDPRTESVAITAGSQRVVLTTGQATVSAGGRLVALSAAVTKDGTRWLVPIDFLRVLDPLLDRRIDIRRGARIVVLDAASVPRLTPRFDRTATGGRLVITIAPVAAARVSRSGDIVTIRFQADALDLSAVPEAPADLLTGIRTVGPSLLVDLGPKVGNVQQEEVQDLTRITLDLIVGAAPPTPTPTPSRAIPPPTAPGAMPTVPPTTTPVATPAPPPATPPAAAPAFERAGTIRTVVIDPGHGGADIGSRSVTGLEEKTITLAVAQRLRGILEAQLGVRVILTRDTDSEVAIDQRAAIANNNKADIFISLHANGSPMPALRGWQVQSLDPVDYAGVAGAGPSAAPAAQSVGVVGGGTRTINIVPWQLAQIPFVRQSESLAGLLAARLADAGIPPHAVPVLQTPARVLVGANMPAVLIELGFLTNAEDADQLSDRTFHAKFAEIVTGVISNLRMGWPTPSGGGDR